MLDYLLSILFLVVGLLIGSFLLIYGRWKLVGTTALISMAAVGSLIAFVVLGENNAWALTEEPNWLLLGITVAAGVIGAILGARAEHIAAAVIGLFAGGYIALWFLDVAIHIVVSIGKLPEAMSFWVGVAVLIIGGILGFLLTRRSEPEALIMISVFVGADIIIRSLNLDQNKPITAVIAISLALLGVVFQYAQYLREINVDIHGHFTDIGPAPAPELFDLSDD